MTDSRTRVYGRSPSSFEVKCPVPPIPGSWPSVLILTAATSGAQEWLILSSRAEKIHTNDLISGNFPYLYGGKENLELFDIPYYDSIARLLTTDGIFLNAAPLAEASYATGPRAVISKHSLYFFS